MKKCQTIVDKLYFKKLKYILIFALLNRFVGPTGPITPKHGGFSFCAFFILQMALSYIDLLIISPLFTISYVQTKILNVHV